MTGTEIAPLNAPDEVLDAEVVEVLPATPPAVLDPTSLEQWLLTLHPLHRASHAPATWRAYASDLRLFTAWCQERHACPLPASPATVMDYLNDQGPTLKLSTLRRRLSAIRLAHHLAGLTSPTVHAEVTQAWRGLARTYGPRQTRRQSGAIITSTLAEIVAPLGDSTKDKRDRALLVVGFAGAFRRSELAGLNVSDIDVLEDGLRITVRKSKTDQEGRGRVVGLPYGSHRATCPVRSWLAWHEAATLDEDGPAFLSMRKGGSHVLPSRIPADAIARVVKLRAAAVGLDPRTVSGHSLRAGFATSAARGGVGDRDIMRQTGHRSPDSLTPYIREGKLFEDNAAARVGL